MQNKKSGIITFIILLLSFSGLQAQQAITTSGGNASGNQGSVSYTVGLIAYDTNSGLNETVAQGVQQPYEISVVSGIASSGKINLECSAYPNPTTDILILKVDNNDSKNLAYELYNINGKLLEIKNLKDNEITIQMKDLIPAIYFLKVKANQKVVKTFKIIKN